MKKWLKTELHTHTIDDPYDGHRIIYHTAPELIDAASHLGFEVLSITNHNLMLFDTELREYAASKGILLIPGVEASLKGKHVLLYNFRDYNPSWKDVGDVRMRKGKDQLVIAAHPFFPSPTALRRHFFRWVYLFDAVEYNHFYLQRVNFNRRAVRVAQQFDLPVVGNADLHRLSQLGKTYTLIYAEKTIESVVAAVKAGNVQAITEPVSAGFLSSWFAGNAARSSHYAMCRLLGQTREDIGLGSPARYLNQIEE